MYLSIITAVVIAFSYNGTPPVGYVPPSDAVMRAILALLVTVFSPVPGMMLASWMRRQDYSDPFRRAWILGRVHFSLMGYQVFLVASFAIITFVIDWPTVINYDLGMLDWVLVDELLRIGPFVLMLLMAWVPLYRIDRMLRGGTWSLREYVEFNFRQYVLFLLAPFALMATVRDLVMLLPEAEYLRTQGLDVLILMAAMGALFVFAPLLIRHVWKTRSLEQGVLRETLSSLCRRARMGCRDILVWETMGGGIVNAAVTGLLAPVRYILLTDAMRDALSPVEIEAVFAHEIGHVKRHHMLFYALMTAGFIGFFLVVGSWLDAGAEESAGLSELLTPAAFVLTSLLIFYWGGMFSYVSRRMELEADLFAAELEGNTVGFVNALERISAASGRPRSANSWRHFSVAKRVDFLLRGEIDPGFFPRFRRFMWTLRAAILVFCVVSVSAAVYVALVGPW